MTDSPAASHDPRCDSDLCHPDCPERCRAAADDRQPRPYHSAGTWAAERDWTAGWGADPEETR
jgi:hypothetical protein